jgi:biotin carboxylase
MTTDGNTRGPVVLVGYALTLLAALAEVQPERSVIFVEEPDVIRKRKVRIATVTLPTLRELIEWEYEDPGAADRFYHRYRDLRPAAVVPISDYAVPFAARLAERYGIPGAGHGAATVLRDKHLQRLVTSAAGIANPQSVLVTGPAEVMAFMSDVGGPILLKPANRRASVGTKIVSDPAEIEAAWIECTNQDEGIFVPDRPMPLRMLAERLVRGDEFSVEMLVRGGRPIFAAATRKFLFDGPYPVEQGHLHPADIDAEQSHRLLADTERVVDAIGMDTGIVHCEWIIENGMPQLVECAGRMAGGGIIELAMLAWQYNVLVQYFRLMQGLPVEPPPATPDRSAATWLSRAPAGYIESVDGLAEARAAAGVHTVVAPAVGDETHELRSSWDRVAMVTAEGATPAEALANAQKAIAMIDIKVGTASP